MAEKGKVVARHVVSVLPGTEPGTAVVSTYVPEGSRVPTHAVVTLPTQAQRRGEIVEHVISAEHLAPLTSALAPVGDAPPGFAPSNLPLTGWSVVVGLYAGTTLVWEESDTEHGLMELPNVLYLLWQKVAAWVQANAVNVEAAYPDANAGPLPNPLAPPY